MGTIDDYLFRQQGVPHSIESETLEIFDVRCSKCFDTVMAKSQSKASVDDVAKA